MDFDTFFITHNEVMLWIDPDSGQIVEANPAAVRFYGYSHEELTSMAIQDINAFTPEQVAAEMALAEEEERHHFIFRHRLADGSIRTVEVDSHPYSIEEQTLLLSLVHDITPHREMEKALWHYQTQLEEMVDKQVRTLQVQERSIRFLLFGGSGAVVAFLLVLVLFLRNREKLLVREVQDRTEKMTQSEEELGWLFHNMLNGFVLYQSVFDENGTFISYRYLFINQAYERILGVTSEQVKGKTVHEVWSFIQPEWIEHYGKVVTTGTPRNFDLYHAPSARYLHCIAYRPWEGTDRFCVIFEDITDQKQSEEREGSLKRMLLAIRNVNQLIIQEDDPSRLIQRACENLTETLGFLNAWIALFNEAGRVTDTASSGFERDGDSLHHCLTADTIPHCIRRARSETGVIVVDDPPNDCPECPLARQYQGRSGLIRALFFQDSLFGVLTVTTDSQFVKDTEIQTLFNELANDLSFALHKIRNQEAFRLIQERYRHLVENAGEGIVVVQHDRCVYVNPALIELTGYDEKTLLDRPFFEFIHQDDRSIAEERYHAVVSRQEKLYRFPLRAIKRDGTVGWIELNAVPVEWEGSPAVLAMIEDITQRKQAEEELVHSHHLMQYIIEHARSAIAVHDRDLKYIYVSQRYLEEYQVKEKDVIGRHHYEVFPDLPQKWRDAHQRALQGEIIGKEDDPYVRQDGTVEWTRWECRPWHESDGSIGGIIIYTEVITERKKAEERIRHLSFHDPLTEVYNRAFFEEESRRLNTFRKTNLGVMLCDLNGLKLINDSFGHSEGDKLLQRFSQVLRDCCRKEDLIARWGGDEFIVLLTGVNQHCLSDLGQRVKIRCQKVSSDLIPLSVSIGWAISADSGQPVEAVISQAEERMYRHKLSESRSARFSIIASLERSLQETTQETQQHAGRMRTLAQKIGQEMDLLPNEFDDLDLLARLHDLGKIAIPSDILNKPGKLTPEEWETIKTHPEIGYRIAESTPELRPIAEAILAHHERFDGTGYPRQLKKEEIPRISRIISVVDAYDVMTSGRPYKQPMSPAEALEELKRSAGTQFDPQVVEIFVNMVQSSQSFIIQ